MPSELAVIVGNQVRCRRPSLATVVGVLIEVPVMLSVVAIVNASKSWYERGPRIRHLAAGPNRAGLKS